MCINNTTTHSKESDFSTPGCKLKATASCSFSQDASLPLDAHESHWKSWSYYLTNFNKKLKSIQQVLLNKPSAKMGITNRTALIFHIQEIDLLDAREFCKIEWLCNAAGDKLIRCQLERHCCRSHISSSLKGQACLSQEQISSLSSAKHVPQRCACIRVPQTLLWVPAVCP